MNRIHSAAVITTALFLSMAMQSPVEAQIRTTSRSGAKAVAVAGGSSGPSDAAYLAGAQVSAQAARDAAAAGRTVTQRFAPTVYVAPVQAASPCERPIQGGVSVIGTGVTAGTSVAIVRCYAQEGFRIYGARDPEMGEAYACRLDSDFRDAMRDIGRPCPQDRATQTSATAAAAPARVVVAEAAPPPLPPAPPAPGSSAWCAARGARC